MPDFGIVEGLLAGGLLAGEGGLLGGAAEAGAGGLLGGILGGTEAAAGGVGAGVAAGLGDLGAGIGAAGAAEGAAGIGLGSGIADAAVGALPAAADISTLGAGALGSTTTAAAEAAPFADISALGLGGLPAGSTIGSALTAGAGTGLGTADALGTAGGVLPQGLVNSDFAGLQGTGSALPDAGFGGSSAADLTSGASNLGVGTGSPTSAFAQVPSAGVGGSGFGGASPTSVLTGGGVGDIASGGSNVAASNLTADAAGGGANSGLLGSLGLTTGSALGLAAPLGMLGYNLLRGQPQNTPQQQQLESTVNPQLAGFANQAFAGNTPANNAAQALQPTATQFLSGHGPTDAITASLSKFSNEALGNAPADTGSVIGAEKGLATGYLNAAAAGNVTQPQQAQIDTYRQNALNQLRQQIANSGQDPNHSTAFTQGVQQIEQQATTMKQQFIDANAKTGLQAGGQVTGAGLQASGQMAQQIQSLVSQGLSMEQAIIQTAQETTRQALAATGQLSGNLLQGAQLQIQQDQMFQQAIAAAVQSVALVGGLSSVGAKKAA